MIVDADGRPYPAPASAVDARLALLPTLKLAAAVVLALWMLWSTWSDAGAVAVVLLVAWALLQVQG